MNTLSNKHTLYIADIASHNNKGNSYGHYFAVAQNYHDTLGCTIIGGPIYKNKFNNCLTLPYDSIKGDNIIFKKWKQLMNCRALFRQCKGDTIILQHVALATAIIGIILFKRKDTKLFLITYNDEGYNRPLMRYVYNIAKKKVNGVICPFEFVGEGYNLPFITVPDYFYSEKQFPIVKVEKKYNLCIVGNITPEKGVLEVINFAINHNVTLIIAGRVSSKELERKLYNAIQNHNNITAIFRFVSEEEYSDIINRSQYCVLNYQDKSYGTRSSGVAYDLLFRRIPIIGRRCTALNYIEKHSMGYLYKKISEIDLKILFKPEQIDNYKIGIEQYIQLNKQFAHLLKDFITRA